MTERNIVGSSGLRVSFDTEAEASARLEALRNLKNRFKPTTKPISVSGPSVPVLVTGETGRSGASLLNSTTISKIQAQVVVGGSTEDSPPSKVILSDGTVLVPVRNQRIKPPDLSSMRTVLVPVTSTGKEVERTVPSPMQNTKSTLCDIQSNMPLQAGSLKPSEAISSQSSKPVPCKLFRAQNHPKEDKDSTPPDEPPSRPRRNRKRKSIYKWSIEEDELEDEDDSVTAKIATVELPIRIKQEPVEYTDEGADGFEQSGIDSEMQDVSNVSQENNDESRIGEELGFVIKAEPPDDYYDSIPEVSAARTSGRRRSRKRDFSAT